MRRNIGYDSDKKQWIQQQSLKLHCVAYVKQAVDLGWKPV